MGQSPAPAFHLQDQDPDSMLWAFLTPGSLPAPLHCPHCPLGCRSPSHPAEATTVRPGPRPRPSPWRGGRGAGVGRQMAEPTWGRPVEVAGKDPLGAHLHAFWKATPGCHLSPNGGPSGRAPSPRPGPHGQRTSVGRPGPCTPGATWAVRCLLRRPARCAHRQGLGRARWKPTVHVLSPRILFLGIQSKEEVKTPVEGG